MYLTAGMGMLYVLSCDATGTNVFLFLFFLKIAFFKDVMLLSVWVLLIVETHLTST